MLFTALCSLASDSPCYYFISLYYSVCPQFHGKQRSQRLALAHTSPSARSLSVSSQPHTKFLFLQGSVTELLIQENFPEPPCPNQVGLLVCTCARTYSIMLYLLIITVYHPASHGLILWLSSTMWMLRTRILESDCLGLESTSVTCQELLRLGPITRASLSFGFLCKMEMIILPA